MTRVLVVDDKEENLYYLRTLLEGDGCEVEVARHGAQALELACAAVPDVVISDLLMPVMDGYQLLRHWRADPRLSNVPFIVYTATYTEPEDEQLAISLGADAFLLKPTEPDAFLARLREVLAAPRTAPKLQPPAALPAEGLVSAYSEILIRKLEQKTLELEASNRSLLADIAARELAEQKLHRAEEQLRQAQKMEAIGQLASGVAHDFNNLLSVILGYSAFVIDRLERDDPLRADVEEIRKAGQRAGELTRELLTFSRKQPLKVRLVDVSASVASLEKMLRRLLGSHVTLSRLAGEGVGRVLADPGQLEQVIVNLAVNARDAMPGGGSLTFETSNAVLDAAYAAEHHGVKAGNYVMLAVSDTGHGMDAATCARIFEPFFTTKEKGKGTGLGLATVYGIVNQSGGHISVDSQVGAGTTFKVYLPRADAAAAAESPPVAPKFGLPRGSETVLLVEDAEEVRASLRATLRRAGYNVLDAANGGEALLACEQFNGEIHLLLTDLAMPRLTGRELAERITRLRAQTKVLYMSGYTADADVHHGGLAPGVPFLPKPISPEALLRSVRDVLDGAAPGSSPAGATTGQGARVLHVDDEEPLVHLTRRLLMRLGYRVEGFTDPARALEAFRAAPGSFDALIVDVSMPGMGGFELVREVWATRAGLPVVVTSGAFTPEDLKEAERLQLSALVVKPDTGQELGRALHQQLQRGR